MYICRHIHDTLGYPLLQGTTTHILRHIQTHWDTSKDTLRHTTRHTQTPAAATDYHPHHRQHSDRWSLVSHWSLLFLHPTNIRVHTNRHITSYTVYIHICIYIYIGVLHPIAVCSWITIPTFVYIQKDIQHHSYTIYICLYIKFAHM